MFTVKFNNTYLPFCSCSNIFSAIPPKKVREHWSHSKGREFGGLLSVLTPELWALDLDVLVEAVTPR